MLYIYIYKYRLNFLLDPTLRFIAWKLTSLPPYINLIFIRKVNKSWFRKKAELFLSNMPFFLNQNAYGMNGYKLEKSQFHLISCKSNQ
jgi:hypothetical protein